MTAQNPLRSGCGFDRGRYGRKDGGHAIPGVVERVSARRLDRIGEKKVVAGQRQPHLRRVIRPEPGRPLNMT
jgi:hypothetical protein